jgi:hypothetical protein
MPAINSRLQHPRFVLRTFPARYRHRTSLCGGYLHPVNRSRRFSG